MPGIVAVKAGNPREQILVALARQQVPVIQRGPSEIGDQRIAGTINANLVVTLELNDIKHEKPPHRDVGMTSP
jgi:hypothetical protein